ncbi:MAG: hypothetical protein O2973_12120 [Gemmatimonadetes bacterium]|nr:hypothetical protein [Gemmatimonadota bacterium]
MQNHIARSVRFPIIAGKKAEFTKVFNSEVLPMLKAQDGFRNEIMLVNDDHVLGISVWSGPDKLDRYATTLYPKIEQKLSSLVNGKVEVETFEMGLPLNVVPA